MRSLAAAEIRSIALAADGSLPWYATALGTSAVASSAMVAAQQLALAGAAGVLGAAFAGAWWWDRRRRAREGVVACAMEISPWGVVALSPSGGIHRWSDLRGLTARVVRDDRRERVLSTHVAVLPPRGTLLGVVVREEPALSLLANAWPHYAGESRRSIALDLGAEHAHEAPEPLAQRSGLFERLRGRARTLRETPEGAAELRLDWSGYRDGGASGAGPETIARLREALHVRSADDPDRAPLVAVLAGELAVRELADDLLTLIMSPNAFVAATCKAAALRLGEAKFRSGPIAEVAPFLPKSELDAMEAWSRPARSSPARGA